VACVSLSILNNVIGPTKRWMFQPRWELRPLFWGLFIWAASVGVLFFGRALSVRCRDWQILLQKSQIVARQVFRQKAKQAVIAD
jgi:hypothetical protein